MKVTCERRFTPSELEEIGARLRAVRKRITPHLAFAGRHYGFFEASEVVTRSAAHPTQSASWVLALLNALQNPERFGLVPPPPLDQRAGWIPDRDDQLESGFLGPIEPYVVIDGLTIVPISLTDFRRGIDHCVECLAAYAPVGDPLKGWEHRFQHRGSLSLPYVWNLLRDMTWWTFECWREHDGMIRGEFPRTELHPRAGETWSVLAESVERLRAVMARVEEAMPQSSTLDGEAVAAANRWDTEAALVLRKLNSLVGVQLDGPAITPQKSAAPCERLLNIRCPAEEFRKQLLDDLERLEVVAWRLVPDREEEKLSPPPEGEDIFEVRLARTWFVDVTRREKSKVRPIHDYTFARWASDSPALTKDKFENGRVYHILGEVLAHPSFAPYRSIFERAYREGYRGAGETRTKAKLLGVSPRKRGGRTRAARDSGKL